VDKQGNVIAGGITQNTGTLPRVDFTIAKFDRDGSLLWLQTLDGTNLGGVVNSVAADNQGNVVAAGFTQHTGTFGDFTVAKFDRDGMLLWQRTLLGTANGGEEASSVSLDSRGNVVVSGVIQNAGTFYDFTVAKFDRDGALLWQQTLNGTANSLDWALSVVVDNQQNVIAGGFTIEAGFDAALTVAKFDRDGALLWLQNINGTASPGNDGATSVAVDNHGNAFAGGFTQNTGTGFSDFTVVKLDR
jgi:hypothetical protein